VVTGGLWLAFSRLLVPHLLGDPVGLTEYRVPKAQKLPIVLVGVSQDRMHRAFARRLESSEIHRH
jgi:hypothetical protein